MCRPLYRPTSLISNDGCRGLLLTVPVILAPCRHEGEGLPLCAWSTTKCRSSFKRDGRLCLINVQRGQLSSVRTHRIFLTASRPIRGPSTSKRKSCAGEANNELWGYRCLQRAKDIGLRQVPFLSESGPSVGLHSYLCFRSNCSKAYVRSYYPWAGGVMALHLYSGG